MEKEVQLRKILREKDIVSALLQHVTVLKVMPGSERIRKDTYSNVISVPTLLEKASNDWLATCVEILENVLTEKEEELKNLMNPAPPDTITVQPGNVEYTKKG